MVVEGDSGGRSARSKRRKPRLLDGATDGAVALKSERPPSDNREIARTIQSKA